MQDSLFPDAADSTPSARLRTGARGARVRPQPPDPAQQALAAALPATLRLGTSSWTYPGWAGVVWDGAYADAVLAKHGLAAYAQHPLLRAVSLDRAFYRALTLAQYAAYAAQVPAHFRFVVKAPSLVANALVRDESGHGMQPNPAFLDPDLAASEFVQPALAGLGPKLGALVFQLSPLPAQMLAQRPELLRRLGRMLQALPALRPVAPDAVIAVELRNAELLGPDLAAVLRDADATYCLGLHAKLPSIEDQLPMLRALWPGPLVCRWNLNRRHGGFGYEKARQRYEPYDHIVDADPDTRRALAKVAQATCRAGQPAYITIGNKAEGSAPLSVLGLAQDIVALQGASGG